MIRYCRQVLSGAALMFAALGAQADEVSVAVAANFAGPLARIAEGFTAATGHTLKVSSGPTGKFYSQILWCTLRGADRGR